MESSQQESYVDFAMYFASNTLFVMMLLHMVCHGYYRKHAQLELLNSVLNIEWKLSVLLKKQHDYGRIAPLTKLLTLWSTFFYVIVMNVMYVVGHYQYETFVILYIETLLLLYDDAMGSFERIGPSCENERTS
uniref:Gustatory receptor n=1 Tax=Anopheles funestus TaxID=62324 RepID=A0A182S390_ANOFN